MWVMRGGVTDGGTTGGHASGHPAVVGTCNERGDCCWGPCQCFWLASVIWSVCSARACHLVWDLAAYTQTRDIDASPAKSHVTCLQPRIYIGPCALEGFCFFVNTTSSQLLFMHQCSFIWTTPVDSGSNDLVLDSLRYVGGTDFYTDHLCFTASLPHHLPSCVLAPLWTFNHGMGYMGGCQCTGRHTYAPG